jgi:hypothetical protein
MAFYMIVAHASFGGVALACAIVAMFAKKGGPLHRKTGLVFAIAMTAATALACVIAVIRPNLFLFLIGLFSLYLVLVGWRAGSKRKKYPARFDYGIAIVVGVASAAMIGVGIDRMTRGDKLGTVLLVFGIIGGIRALVDLRQFRAGKITGQQRIVRHLTSMVAAFIAASTAFLVVTADFLPELVRWFGPTFALTPVIIYHSTKLRGAKRQTAKA